MSQIRYQLKRTNQLYDNFNNRNRWKTNFKVDISFVVDLKGVSRSRIVLH